MPFPFAMAALGGLGALGGLFGRPKPKDMNIYAMDSNQRKNLGNSMYNQTQGLYQSDPNAFWGGDRSWTTSGGILPNSGADIGRMLFGAGGPGGGGGGRRVGWSGASSGGGPASIDVNEEIYQLTLPEAQRQRLLTQGNEYYGSQAQDAIRQMNDVGVQSGSYGSPAQIAQQAAIERQRLKSLSDQVRGNETDWFSAAGGRRHEALSTNAQLKEAAMQRAMQASIANAQGRLSAGQFNAGSGDAADARRQAATLALLGMRGQDEDRMLQRYGMLNDQAMRGVSPIGQKTMGQSTMGSVFGGMGAGMNLYNMFRGGGGGFGGGSGGDYGWIMGQGGRPF